MSTVEELLGADYAVHNILHPDIGVEEAVAVLRDFHGETVQVGIQPTGNNLVRSYSWRSDRNKNSNNLFITSSNSSKICVGYILAI